MPDPTPSASISTSLNLAKALGLARQGRLQAAQLSLSGAGGPPADPVELHALAALVTSAGDFPRALGLWHQLLRQDPRHAEARRMIDAIELWQSRPPWYRFIPAGAAALGIGLAAVVVLLIFAPSAPAPQPVSPIVSAPIAPAPLPPATAQSPAATQTPDTQLRINFHSPAIAEKHKRKSAR